MLSPELVIELTLRAEYTRIRIMQQETEWSIIFYVNERGHEPVREFLQSLDLTTQARFAWSIEQLLTRNVQAREPLVRHLEGKLWEMREESQTNIYRLLYFFFTGRRIFFCMAFKSRARKRPGMRSRLLYPVCKIFSAGKEVNHNGIQA
jgi:phage-related protein